MIQYGRHGESSGKITNFCMYCGDIDLSRYFQIRNFISSKNCAVKTFSRCELYDNS